MNKKLIESLAKLANVSDVEAFTTALQSETDTDFQLDTDNLTVYTNEQLDALKTTLTENVTKNVKDKAFSDAFEIQIKNMKKQVGLEYEGKKSEDFIKNFKLKVLEEANIEPNKMKEDYESSMEKLRNQITERDQDYLELQREVTNNKIRFDAKSFIPELPENLGISKDDATNLYFMSHEVKEDGIYKNGTLQKNNMEKPLSQQESITAFITEKKWNATPSGRGGGAGSGDGKTLPKTMDEYESMLSERGLNPGSAEANALLQEVAKENPEILD